jgi:hypothetical protein
MGLYDISIGRHIVGIAIDPLFFNRTSGGN